MPGTPRLIPHLCGWWPHISRANWAEGGVRVQASTCDFSALCSTCSTHTCLFCLPEITHWYIMMVYNNMLFKHTAVLVGVFSMLCIYWFYLSEWSSLYRVWTERWIRLCVGVQKLGDAGEFRAVVLCWFVTQTGFVSSGGAAGRASRKAHGLEC